MSKPPKFELTDTLHGVSHRWYEFGVALGIERRVLDGYKLDCAPMSAVIEFWWKGNAEGGRPVTWQSVVTALERINEHALAETIRKNHHCS